ncbi:VWA domain-containing protein [Dermacoccus nishinomiyaensis]|uniref:VWA domain-containing protein n=1 Tax=Dermacoccus TaxID=57495 RepID=UPI0001E63DCB|nr:MULTISPECIES: VWA domain-containing protein [Dermacoccus]EFP58215.1 hypothetical protein HMPREF0321_1100 [Dermacoccus sp. Ellin185]TJZ95954.1 VWA domain-containing protein [Dermacoccus nishinomiyaensis]
MPDDAVIPAGAGAPGAGRRAAHSDTAGYGPRASVTSSAGPGIASAGVLQRRLVSLANALRRHGVVVGTSDVIDAGRIVTALGLDDRERLREGLASAFMRRGEQRRVFDELFDLYFPAALGARTRLTDLEEDGAADKSGAHPDGEPEPDSLDALDDFDPLTADAAALRERARALQEILAQALAAQDERALNALAATVVTEFGVLRREGENGFSANQAIEQFQPNLAIARASELMQQGPEAGGSDGGTAGGSSGGGGGGSGQAMGADQGWQPERFTPRLDRDDARERVAAFRRRVETETRRRNAEIRGVERLAEHAVTTPLERRAFSQTYAVDAAEMRRVVDPLARKLAARMAAKRRRASHGRIDIRRTLRASMSTGGVPIEPVFTHHAPNRSELVILADMSSSVAGFSRFTILLMQAMQAQFARVRVFGFVNTVDELTAVVKEVGRDGDLVEALKGNRRMTRGHRNSDYGQTFADFVEHHLDAVTPRATVLILGDARTNNTDPRYDALRTIAQQARHAMWLNPEAESQWGQGDSVAHRYAAIVDMHEVRTITDLREFVARAL